jgi:hypothetical protein
MELSDRRVAVVEQLLIHRHVARADISLGQSLGQVQHGLAPRPEVTTLRATPERPLKRVAVRVDEARQYETLHRRIVTRSVRTRDHERSSVPP